MKTHDEARIDGIMIRAALLGPRILFAVACVTIIIAIAPALWMLDICGDP